MAGNPKIQVGALNIAASPHPVGVYRRLLELAANVEIHLHGSDWGKITAVTPLEDRPELLTGRVVLWAHIDKDGKWLNKKKNIEATPIEKQSIVLPPDFEPNFRSFYFVFNEPTHRLVVELRNELGQTFGPSRAEKFFAKLFNHSALAEVEVEVAVTVIPTEDALDRIFDIPRLRWLRIHNTRPNAEDLSDEAEILHARLKAMGAKSQDLELAKAAKVTTIKPDGEIRALADAAAVDGHVEGRGKTEAGANVYESTKLHPKVVEIEVQGGSSFTAFLSSLLSLL
ncbi:DUF4747 family protein [Bradyrhizobium sp. 192]|uniref:DUF4747 family protein n=1 Tax=Bradyrhizobium sp. 192 TaxID=2782660 RepID=UPI0020004648|nr:DUF4747 family protein [Bradyrhizobium sp. 192]UPJ57827.1 DUF4747 family protein [Bradyrhizobium sp. 192]